MPGGKKDNPGGGSRMSGGSKTTARDSMAGGGGNPKGHTALPSQGKVVHPSSKPSPVPSHAGKDVNG